MNHQKAETGTSNFIILSDDNRRDYYEHTETHPQRDTTTQDTPTHGDTPIQRDIPTHRDTPTQRDTPTHRETPAHKQSNTKSYTFGRHVGGVLVVIFTNIMKSSPAAGASHNENLVPRPRYWTSLQHARVVIPHYNNIYQYVEHQSISAVNDLLALTICFGPVTRSGSVASAVLIMSFPLLGPSSYTARIYSVHKAMAHTAEEKENLPPPQMVRRTPHWSLGSGAKAPSSPRA